MPPQPECIQVDPMPMAQGVFSRLATAAMLATDRASRQKVAPPTSDPGGTSPNPERRRELRGAGYDAALALQRYFVRRRWSRSGLPRRRPPTPLASPQADSLCAAIERATGAIFSPGNRTELLSSNAEDFRARLRLIATATRRIVANFWIVKPDPTGRAFIDALAARARDGVEVTLGLCHETVRREQFIDPSYLGFLRSAAEAGVDVRLIRSENSAGHHRKILVVDGETAVLGGRNIGDDYALDERSTSFTDVDVLIRGPAAVEIERTALERIDPTPRGPADHEISGREIDDPAESVAVVQHVPGPDAFDPVLAGLLAAIDHARTSVDLAFGYLFPVSELRSALAAAAARGVRVRVLSNSTKSVDYPWWDAAYAALAPLVEAGLPLYLMRDQPLHMKAAVIDGRIALIGSHNLWPYSTLHEYESVVFVDSADIAARITKQFESVLAKADRVERSAGLPVKRGLGYRLSCAIYAWSPRDGSRAASSRPVSQAPREHPEHLLADAKGCRDGFA